MVSGLLIICILTMATIKEISLKCSDGITIAGQCYSASSKNEMDDGDAQNILCLHGWLDNCRSFHSVAPELLGRLSSNGNQNINIVAIDFPGHGASSHKSIDGPLILYTEYVYYVNEVLHQLNWISNSPLSGKTSDDKKITLIGHSMGAGVSCVYAATFPEHIGDIVLLDGAGPYPRDVNSMTKNLKNHIVKRLNGNRIIQRTYQSKTASLTICDNLDQAIEMRCATAASFPGNQYISKEAARELVLRSSYNPDSDNDGEKIAFRHDMRLRWPSIQYFTMEQLHSIYESIQCRILLLLAEHSFPVSNDYESAILDVLKPTKMKTLEGSHHFHADPTTSKAVVDEIFEFLKAVE